MLKGVQRRQFLLASSGIFAGLTAGVTHRVFAAVTANTQSEPLYGISLAEWSLHRTIFDGKLDHLDFVLVAKNGFDIGAVEYVNQFFKDKAKDQSYLGEMKRRADHLGVKNLLIMIDGEGALGDPDSGGRKQAIENHHKWVEAAKFLGCHSIRVNARSRGSFEEQQKLASDGLRRLSEFASDFDLNVIVENHGGLSSNGQWLSAVIKSVELPNCGTLPDFGNFRVSRDEQYDRYKGVTELMPFAKAVSAKSYDFDDSGNDLKTDYRRMMKIVVDAGYRGYVGIEYEGSRISEPAGIWATKRLLESARDELS